MLEMGVLGSRMMGLRVGLFLAFICIRIGCIKAYTNETDYNALQALTGKWENLPSNWTGRDPCGSNWVGIRCNNYSRIINITLPNLGLKGQLTGDLLSISELQILDLSNNRELTGSVPQYIGQLSKLTSLYLIGCGLDGRIPNSIGSLKQLVNLSLNKNNLTGQVPRAIGKLKNLYWLDLSENQLHGSIPVSNGSLPGLDLLVNTQHFHFGQNNLSGTISPRLFHSNMTLIHVLFDNNNLTGSIPETLSLVSTLEVVRFDRNHLSRNIPTNIGNLTGVINLQLSNNELTGLIPDLGGMVNLNYLDLSNNSFDATEVPKWLTTLESLTTLKMEETGLEGRLPEEFFNIPQLQTVMLKNNRINGTLEIGSSYSRKLRLIDLQNNSIDKVVPSQHTYNFSLVLAENSICENVGVTYAYCNNQGHPPLYIPTASCSRPSCTSEQVSGPACKCAYPLTGKLILRAPNSLRDPTYFFDLQQDLLRKLQNFRLPVESVAFSSVLMDIFGNLIIQLEIFPAGQVYFNTTGMSLLVFVFNSQAYKPPDLYEPYVFYADPYKHLEGNKNFRKYIIGGTIGALILLFLICVGGYAYYRWKRARKAKQQANPFVVWDSHGTDGDIPHLKGAQFFTLEELQKFTNNFSEANNIGSGGYGKVYKGILANGQIVAIKRSEQGSMQGSQEFKNEVELLSRVHHKNLVKLIGFCFDKGEQMLVYEYIPNGTLMGSLSGESGIQLDWRRRLMATLGSARGLQYLHEHADPPIIHRDIKSNNILLDERLNAKVADFGISKLFGDIDQKGYVTTQVKGTMGYLDPEYFMTNQLTEKSDTFSFGVVMLEMVTARRPIQGGKYIVRVIKKAMDRTKDLYNLQRVIDPLLIRNTIVLVGLEKFVELALKCVRDEGANRPTMGEVVKEIEHIVQLAGMNPNAESASSSQSYENTGDPYSDTSIYVHTGSTPLTRNVRE